jgi:hypothetical protein
MMVKISLAINSPLSLKLQELKFNHIGLKFSLKQLADKVSPTSLTLEELLQDLHQLHPLVNKLLNKPKKNNPKRMTRRLLLKRKNLNLKNKKKSEWVDYLID